MHHQSFAVRPSFEIDDPSRQSSTHHSCLYRLDGINADFCCFLVIFFHKHGMNHASLAYLPWQATICGKNCRETQLCQARTDGNGLFLLLGSFHKHDETSEIGLLLGKQQYVEKVSKDATSPKEDFKQEEEVFIVVKPFILSSRFAIVLLTSTTDSRERLINNQTG